MTMTETAMSTDDMLAAMLTENTGRHMLDSGGAYGRNFERNAGKAAADFRAAPEVNVDTWERNGHTVVEYITLDIFHFLSDRLDYNAEVDAAFHEFALADERADESWFTCLNEWLNVTGARWQGSDPMVVNTCNGEDSLSQVMQFAMFEHPDTDEPMAALMIHGGCDYRGGYTAPRMFDLGTYHEYALLDNADFTVVLTEPEATPEQLAQAAMFAEYPVPTGGRQVMLDFRGGYGDRNCEPWNDASLDAITFEFGETPVLTADDGTMTIGGDGPAAGWSLNFYPPCAG